MSVPGTKARLLLTLLAKDLLLVDAVTKQTKFSFPPGEYVLVRIIFHGSNIKDGFTLTKPDGDKHTVQQGFTVQLAAHDVIDSNEGFSLEHSTPTQPIPQLSLNQSQEKRQPPSRPNIPAPVEDEQKTPSPSTSPLSSLSNSAFVPTLQPSTSPSTSPPPSLVSSTTSLPTTTNASTTAPVTSPLGTVSSPRATDSNSSAPPNPSSSSSATAPAPSFSTYISQMLAPTTPYSPILTHKQSNLFRLGGSNPNSDKNSQGSSTGQSQLPGFFEGRYSLAFPSISTQAYGFDIDMAAQIASDAIKEFLDTHKDPEIKLYMVDIVDSPTLQKFKQLAPKDPRYTVQQADLTALKSAGIPCWYIVNASNPGFHGKGSGTNQAIHKACKFTDKNVSLEKLTLRLYQPPAEVGKAYPVDLIPGGLNALTDAQNVHTVIHVVGPNMNPKRKNCLNGDYVLGAKLLKKAYHELLLCFYDRCGLSAKSGDVPLARWCHKPKSSPSTFPSPLLTSSSSNPTVSPWTPYSDAFSSYLDHVYSAALKNPCFDSEKRIQITLGPSVFDFTNMTETSGSRVRKIARGTWFFQEDDGDSWTPYPSDIANQLEKAFQTGNFDRVDVTHDPPRFVVQLANGDFVQYRQTKNAARTGRPVSRGFLHTTFQVDDWAPLPTTTAIQPPTTTGGTSTTNSATTPATTSGTTSATTSATSVNTNTTANITEHS